jgi:hypothetical protein
MMLMNRAPTWTTLTAIRWSITDLAPVVLGELI